MKIKFTLREYVKSNGLSPVYLNITAGTRVRINLDIDVNPKKWDKNKQRLLSTDKTSLDTNLMLDNIYSKLTDINTVYRLSNKTLTPEIMKNELINGMPRVKLTSFIDKMINEEVSLLSDGTIGRHRAVLNKIKEYDNEASFLDINEGWVLGFKKFLAKKGNVPTTINSNLASLKKFLNLAVKFGIKLSISIDMIKIGSTNGNRTALMPSEVKRLLSYFDSEFIPDNYKVITGYFLFSCMTGLRISDLQKINRENIVDNELAFKVKKTKKTDTIKLNKTALMLLEKEPSLLIKHFADQHMNDELKKICKIVGISKKVSFHVARHTFATGFIRAGGNVEQLQLLMGHSSLSQTMVYVHMVKSEANESLSLLDTLYS